MEQPNRSKSQHTKQDIRKRKHTELHIDGKNSRDSKHASIIKLSFKVNNKDPLSDDNNQDVSQSATNKTLKITIQRKHVAIQKAQNSVSNRKDKYRISLPRR